MYLNCGKLHNTGQLKEQQNELKDSSDGSRSRTAAEVKSETKIAGKISGCRLKESKESFTLHSDWVHLEGVYAKEFNEAGGREKVAHFLSALSELLTSYVLSESDRSAKVLDFHHPHQLKEMMSHCLDINPQPTDLEQILSDCRETLKYCVKTGIYLPKGTMRLSFLMTAEQMICSLLRLALEEVTMLRGSGHPHFFNQLSTGIDVIGMAGTWLAASANTNMFTYEVAPVFTLMEEVIFTRMKNLIGWQDGDAIFVPGGALANLYGVLLARHQAMPEVKRTGMSSGTRPVIFTSEQSHFSIKRAAAILGIGTDNVIFVKCLNNGKMDLRDLQEKLRTSQQEGAVPIMINATCGTTVLGAFDPIIDLADLCQQQGIWLHLDAAWGGGAVLSSDYKYLFQGMERADSITWNPHKMMGVPLQCSAFLTKHKGLMKLCNSMGATYLFQRDKHYDVSYDTGDMSIQCGRHNDVFKLWLMWKAKGDLGFEEQISKNFQLAALFRDKVKERAGFHLVLDKIEAPNVCFWYMPPSWRTRAIEKVKHAHLHKVAPMVKAKMMESGGLMVQYQPLGDLPNLFRVAISNPSLTTRDLDYILDEIDFLGKEIPLPADWDDESLRDNRH